MYDILDLILILELVALAICAVVWGAFASLAGELLFFFVGIISICTMICKTAE